MQMQAVAFVPEMSYFAAPEGRIFVDQLARKYPVEIECLQNRGM
jgi:hypothetical protein